MGTKQLTDCPSNLKEAIDWILRVTGKDTVSGGGDGGTEGLQKAVQELLRMAGVENNNPKILINKDLIDNLADGLAKFIGYTNPGNGTIGTGGIAASGQPVNPSATGTGYKLTYDRGSATWSSSFGNNGDSSIAAKIFLGCVPMIFSSLTYLYWRCDDKGDGEWTKYGFNQSGALKNFMVGMGYKASELSLSMRGSHISISAMNDKFDDFKKGMTAAAQTATERANKEKQTFNKLYPGGSFSENNKPAYPEFLKALQQNGETKAGSITNNANGNSFSIFYHIAKLYFSAKQAGQSTITAFERRGPSTIREMLYFLAALPFSPSYASLNEHITSLFQSLSHNTHNDIDAVYMIPVADTTSVSSNNTLSAANVKDYLTSTCLCSSSLLAVIQGNSGSPNPDKPWLYSLFSNSMNLHYPSGPALFKKLADYAYALQFQLTFLYKQCRGAYSKSCGWQACRFGSRINPQQDYVHQVPSHICNGYNCNGNEQCNHKSTGTCKHNEGAIGAICGKGADSNSPLQAFLTDKLQGFSRSKNFDPLSTNHLDNHPPGFLCHVKMGFSPADLRSEPGIGNHVYSALDTFCGDAHGPLPHLSEKLGCLTNRTPRILGDVFGFLWQLTGQMFNKPQILGKVRDALSLHPNSVDDFIAKLTQSLTPVMQSTQPKDSGLVKSLEAMAPTIPFLYQLFTVNPDDFLPVRLFNLAEHCHKVDTSDVGFKISHQNSSNPAVTSGHDCRSYPNDLWSIYQPVRPTFGGGDDSQEACRGTNCGGYLYPLTHSDGATYAPTNAPAYLSWLAYLTDDFHEWFENLLADFTNIDCKMFGCKGRTCQGRHGLGQHGSVSPQCACQSVVQCGGVLPLLYRHGFQFTDAYSLNGGRGGNDKSKRSCQNFHKQLSNVLSENAPLAKLLESIDSFLYMFRFYFFYNLSSFWLCSLAILAYFIFYGMDVLHFKSHVHFPSSHSVPPIGLLTTGKGPALTKLTYYMP
ncbi:variant erythrocyte surface antigen-1 family protein [Babesia caballi]|uniref:Variant erythrocyte surface antigen-1 family protein n=1 Tax=Babesia caballi TaxID=5871 RepID=A0AAV4LVK9_BABCB|nr:variant erythrocyte surface antigen-1 family protein [Babesia caballi]